MLHSLNFDSVDVAADAVAAFLSKLNDVSTDSAKRVHHVDLGVAGLCVHDFVFTLRGVKLIWVFTKSSRYSVSQVLRYYFRGDRVPPFLVNFDTLVKLAEVVVPPPVVLLHAVGLLTEGLACHLPWELVLHRVGLDYVFVEVFALVGKKFLPSFNCDKRVWQACLGVGRSCLEHDLVLWVLVEG
jgi:hypothetical protein